jgi:hypothetical protein
MFLRNVGPSPNCRVLQPRIPPDVANRNIAKSVTEWNCGHVTVCRFSLVAVHVGTVVQRGAFRVEWPGDTSS